MSDSLKDKAEGKAKEVKGKVTGDQATETEGKAQQTVGNIKGKADEVASNVREAQEEHARSTDEATRRQTP
jgi:uncharacterized protein YjbJ (UPF0337 family)